MTRLSRTLPALALALIFAATAVAADKSWTPDFKGAKKTAASEGKDILMDFTGSDWCPPCISLHKNVFESETFKKQVPKHFVLVVLDFPRDKSKMKPETIKQNDQLKEAYPIGGFPTIFLADATGRPYYRTVGYGGTPASDYTKTLLEWKEKRVKRDEYLKKAADAKGIEKAKLLHEALSFVHSDLYDDFYKEEVDAIIAADPDNKAGLKGRYAIAKELKAIEASARRDGPEATIKKLDKLVKDHKPTGEPLQKVLFLKGAMLYRTDKAAAKEAITAALAAAPDSSEAPRIKAIIARAFPAEAPKEEKKEEPKKLEKE